MAVNRIEVAIDCDDPMTEGIEVLAMIVSLFDLDPLRDVESVLTPGDDGRPVLVAVLTHDDPEEPTDDSAV